MCGHRPPGWQGQDESEALCVEKGTASWVTCQALVQSCLQLKGRGSTGPALTQGQTASRGKGGLPAGCLCIIQTARNFGEKF